VGATWPVAETWTSYLWFVTLHLHLDFSSEFVDYVITGGLCDVYELPVMNIIYACDDLCYLCEYLRLLEKKKEKKKRKTLRREKNPLLSAKGSCSTMRWPLLRREQNPKLSAKISPSTSAKYYSRRSSHLQRVPKVLLSAKGPSSMSAKYLALGEGPFFNECKIFGSRQRSGPNS
jgi:hypothetical protein